MQNPARVVGIAVLLALCSSLTAAEQQWLRYRTLDRPTAMVSGASWHQTTVKTEAPSGTKMPEFKGSSQYHATWQTPMAPDGTVNLAFDRTRKYGSYDRLFADTDCDGRLDDEEPLKPSSLSTYQARFGPAAFRFPGKDGPVTYHLNVMLYTYNNEPRCYLASAGWYEGTVEVNGQKLACRLVDRTGNGCFNDVGTTTGNSDSIQLGGDETDTPTIPGKLIAVGDAFYELSVARDGAWVALAPATNLTLGEVEVDPAVDELILGGPTGRFVVTPKQGIATFPAGAYRVMGWVVNRKDKDGSQWTMRGDEVPESEKDATVTVTKESRAALKAGEPPVASLTIRQTGTGSYYINQTLAGKYGESVTLTRDGKQPAAPKLKVTNEGGTYSQSFDFEYG